MIRRLLIANRGEIACRILRTAQSQGIECAVIHSDADHAALHVRMADAAFCAGEADSRDSYLNSAVIIDIARQWQADAIHPGYGFLSENSDFAAAVEAAGMLFVGPPPAAIAAMGSKARAKSLMLEAGVPVLPGYHGEESDDPSALARHAGEIGYPLLIKAVAGGGGRGMRIVQDARHFPDALLAVMREAESTFGDAGVLLEKYLPEARHVEVQIFADAHGNVVHLHERDCSVQRRHQKLIEEAPAPGLEPVIRAALGDTAVQAARAIGYRGAGTVEFLLQDDRFWFMEMNTRLQVEHPVTESITGLDLVAWQLQVAAGEPLPLIQQEIPLEGCAVEARLNAESPENGFLPSSGRIGVLSWPHSPSLRIDSGFMAGDSVPVHYDSLLAKLIVHAPDRGTALRRLSDALQQIQLTGPATNAAFLAAVLDDTEFRAGPVPTTWLERSLQRLLARMQNREPRPQPAVSAPDWQALGAWRNLVHNPFSRRYHLRGEPAPGHRNVDHGENTGQSDRLLAPLPGRIIAVHVKPGDRVSRGQPLLVMEAMKMEHTITAQQDGDIAALHCETGQLVQPEALLIEFSGDNAP